MKVKKLIKKLLKDPTWKFEGVGTCRSEVMKFGNLPIKNNPDPTSFIITFTNPSINARFEISAEFSDDFSFRELREMLLDKS